MIASKSSGSFKDDCRLLNIEIHAGSSEAHEGFDTADLKDAKALLDALV